MSKKNNWDKDRGAPPIEDLFNAIKYGDLKGVESAIKSGANMRIKMDGMYPIQRAMLAEAMVDERDPRKIDIRKILTLIEKKSKAAGILNDKGEIVDKGGDRSNDEEEWVLVNKDPEFGEVAKITEAGKGDDERSLSDIRRRLEEQGVSRQKNGNIKEPTINNKKGRGGKTPSL